MHTRRWRIESGVCFVVLALTLVACPVRAQTEKPGSRPSAKAVSVPKPTGEAKSAPDFLEDWTAWSKNTVKVLQDAKALQGQDLSSTRTIVGTVEANVTRLKRAVKLEDEFNKVEFDTIVRYIQQLDAMIDRIIKDGVVRTRDKKAAITELETMRSAVQVRVAALHARKTLLYKLGQDLTSLQVRFRGTIDAAKLAPENKQNSLDTIAPLETVGAACSEAAQRDSDQYDQLHERELRIDESIALMKSL